MQKTKSASYINQNNIFLSSQTLQPKLFPTVAIGDSLDWKGLTPDEMEKRILKRVKNGSIILLHNGAKHTAKALPQILNSLVNEGYSFKTVSELIYKDNYTIDHAGMQKGL